MATFSFAAMGSALYSHLAAGTALISKLGGGTAIWDTLAPQGTADPYVVFFHSGGGDDNLSPRRTRNMVYTVKVVGTTKLTTEEIDAEVDALLHMGTLTVTGWGNWWLAREADVAYQETAGNNITYWHRGGQYRVRLTDNG